MKTHSIHTLAFKPALPQSTDFYIESRIDAFGRIFAIKVTDEKCSQKPFKVGYLNIYGTDLVSDGYEYELRSDAIRKCSELALGWIVDGDSEYEPAEH